MIVNVYLSAASMFPIVFNSCLCLIFSHQFKLVKRQIKHEACRGVQLSFLDKNPIRRSAAAASEHLSDGETSRHLHLHHQLGMCGRPDWYLHLHLIFPVLVSVIVFWERHADHHDGLLARLGSARNHVDSGCGSILVNNSVSDKNRVFPKVVLPIKLSSPKCKMQIVVYRFKFIRLQLIVPRQ